VAARAEPQPLQKREPPGFSVPQDAHATIGAKHAETGTEPEVDGRPVWI
jgi:hypothetical protein